MRVRGISNHSTHVLKGKRFNLLNAGFSPRADICFSGSHALKALMRDSCCNLGVMRTRSGLRMSAAAGCLRNRCCCRDRCNVCVGGGWGGGWTHDWTHLQVRQPGLQLRFPDGVAVDRLQPERVKTRRMSTGSTTAITENRGPDHMKGSFHKRMVGNHFGRFSLRTFEPHDPVLELV